MKAFVAAVALSAAAAAPVSASAQAPLAVPYLPQTEALCGGAAAAMVMRFWGARDIYADAFAPLVDRSAGGIHTSALAAALEARGWRPDAGGGDLPRLAAELARGRPVIALIEDRPRRFHYVVVISALASGPVVVHDPARAPSRTIDRETFDARWRKSDRWMLTLLPPLDGVPPAPAPVVGRGDPEPARLDSSPAAPAGSGGGSAAEARCAADVENGVAMVTRGQKDAARRTLEAAAAACPDAGAPWRELAGLDALDQQWDAAAEHARRAVAADPGDAHAWHVLATAEYLRHDDLAALAAWNRVGEPRTDLVKIDGLRHTRYSVIADAIAVRPREILTPRALRLAQKRVREIPAVSTARVTFRPLDRSEAQVDATVVERERAPVTYPAWAAIGAGAGANRELSASLVNVSGGGDAVDVSWRWWDHRPKVAVSYAAPGPGGIWGLAAFRETQTFGASPFEQTRTHTGIEVGNWIAQRVRLTAGAGLDRWSDRERTGLLSGRVEFWPVIDRLALDAGGTGWGGSGRGFGAADLRVRWRSSTASTGTVWLANAGYALASSSAPVSIWPGADTGHARDVLLRAHPLLEDGVIRDGVFGRRIAFGGLEAQQWIQPRTLPILRVAPAAFVDIARATRGLADSDTRWQYDAGAGLRLSLPGFGVLRVDVAHGLRDGRTAFSVGWQR